MKPHIELVGLVLELGARVERLERALADTLASSEPSLPTQTAARSLVAALAAALRIPLQRILSRDRSDRLPEARWLIAHALHVQRFSQSEIARAMGWTCASAVHYALQRFGECRDTDPAFRLAAASLAKVCHTEHPPEVRAES